MKNILMTSVSYKVITEHDRDILVIQSSLEWTNMVATMAS
jgi:hypothetical protein